MKSIKTKRSCPFCFDRSSSLFGTRDGTWLRCRACRSVFRDITMDKFERLHDEACQDGRFVDSVVGALGLEPAIGRWEALSMPGKSVLEIGPGTGHLLAAARNAGRSVTAVESSEVHRAFIRDAWGIESIYEDIADLPQGLRFDAVVGINVIEHVYNVSEFLRSITNVLAPNGIIYISTANAVSLEATLLGAWWSMCKDSDHVSLPSLVGIARAAKALNLRAERVWSSELPFELPISVLVAARDWNRARRAASVQLYDGHIAAVSGQSGTPATARLAHLYSVGAPFDPTSRLLSALGRGGSVKARLRPA
jgi:2-polyprenyl-3-methyl-5-hydroxy-6-metoxy-1,4-benzoquinol methylase